MTIRLTDVTRELMAAGLHGEQLLDALGRIEALAAAEVHVIKREQVTGGVSGAAGFKDESGQRILNAIPSAREPGVDMDNE